MSSLSLLRLATRSPTNPFLRTQGALRASPIINGSSASSCIRAGAPLVGCRATRAGSGASHADETYDEFNARFEKEFDNVHDVFELQRNLNNVFAYDLVPSVPVILAALRAARRVNDFPTAVRIFEGVKAKVENKSQYLEYLEETKEHREEYGVPLREELYPDLR